jgi:hypothetical protein
MSPTAVIDLAAHADARRSHASAAARGAARSQMLYERIVTRAAAARRRDFRHALASGLGLDELSQAAGLEPNQVEAIIARQPR